MTRKPCTAILVLKAVCAATLCGTRRFRDVAKMSRSAQYSQRKYEIAGNRCRWLAAIPASLDLIKPSCRKAVHVTRTSNRRHPDVGMASAFWIGQRAFLGTMETC